MIGVEEAKYIIVAIGTDGFGDAGPCITKCQGPYETEEGCLSHTGTKQTLSIEVAHTDPERARSVLGFTDYGASHPT